MCLNSVERHVLLPARFLSILLLTASPSAGLLTYAAARQKSNGQSKGVPAGQLYTLAARAEHSSTLPSLRRYAESVKDPEQRGLAYFTLGYREYEAGEYSRAATDLGRATSTRFSLSELASIYQAEAAQAAQDPGHVVEALQDFSAKYARSVFEQHALALLADALLELKQPERAIAALTADPKTEQRPALALLLARAYWQAQQLLEAAKAFDHLYYSFPVASESDVAGAALKQLRPQLGESFPVPTEQTESHRVELLASASRYAEALKGYDALLEAHSASPLVGKWKVDRARCLVRLKRFHDAVTALSAGTVAPPDVDAERLETLVDAYARLDDPGSMLIVLDQLRNVYPQSPAYRSGLLRAGTFFIGRGDWATAARYYQQLADAAPTTDLGREAHWRVAWSYYVEPDDDKASQALADHLKRYPDSPHAPAALYWLGRLAEKQGTLSEARSLFELLEKRFVDGYYPFQASARIKILGAKSAPRTPNVKGSSVRGPVGVDLTELSQSLSPRPAHERAELCAPARPGPILSPLRTLTALSLTDIAERYLKAVVTDDPSSTEALLALARLETDQEQYGEALFNAKRLVPNYFDYEFSELPRDTWQWLYPRGFWSLVQRQARVNHLDPYLVMALIRQESAFNPKATSVANARGLMQMLPKTATSGVSRRRRRRVAQRLYDPSYNISVACRYLREVLLAFNGNVEETLAAYNAGDFRVKDWLKERTFREPAEFVESIPFRETRLYVESVLRDEVVYRKLMSGSPKFMTCDGRLEN